LLKELKPGNNPPSVFVLISVTSLICYAIADTLRGDGYRAVTYYTTEVMQASEIPM
jgi:hypothetical protein